MGETTGISWTDHTFNPWWGCWKIADECKNCYADTTANRYNPGLWGRTAPRRFMGEKYWAQLAKWNAKAERDGVRRRVFIGSMCDWAELHPVDEINRELNAARSRMWREIRQCTALDFLMLTKRIDDVAEHMMLPWLAPHLYGFDDSETRPWSNVWGGVTAGTTEAVINKVATLRTLPFAVRFISGEPLLEDIPRDVWIRALDSRVQTVRDGIGPIHWLILGDESGHGARHADPAWMATAIDAARTVGGIAIHLKQWAGPDHARVSSPVPGERKGRKIHLPILDGRQYAEFPTVTPAK